MFTNVKADIRRLESGGSFTRALLRGLLSQGFQAILVYRFFHWCSVKGIPTQPLRFIVERFIEITTGISIPASCKIGPGLRIHHFGGIIMHPSVKIGAHCTLYHGVTIGDRGGYGNSATIGDTVMIGAGAKIIGEVNIGNNSKIGANAVVSVHVPEGSLIRAAGCEIVEGHYAKSSKGEQDDR
jgi:serine O-acetyltransferase